MRTIKKYVRRIVIDAAGYGLILLSILTGWLPGPGGIPLFLAGLGLLSIHNSWAKRLLQYVKTNGVKFLELIFPDKVWVKALHDVIVLVLLGVITYLLINANSAVAYALAFTLAVLATVDLLYNRKRWQTFRSNKQK